MEGPTELRIQGRVLSGEDLLWLRRWIEAHPQRTGVGPGDLSPECPRHPLGGGSPLRGVLRAPGRPHFEESALGFEAGRIHFHQLEFLGEFIKEIGGDAGEVALFLVQPPDEQGESQQ